MFEAANNYRQIKNNPVLAKGEIENDKKNDGRLTGLVKRVINGAHEINNTRKSSWQDKDCQNNKFSNSEQLKVKIPEQFTAITNNQPVLSDDFFKSSAILPIYSPPPPPTSPTRGVFDEPEKQPLLSSVIDALTSSSAEKQSPPPLPPEDFLKINNPLRRGQTGRNKGLNIAKDSAKKTEFNGKKLVNERDLSKLKGRILKIAQQITKNAEEKTARDKEEAARKAQTAAEKKLQDEEKAAEKLQAQQARTKALPVDKNGTPIPPPMSPMLKQQPAYTRKTPGDNGLDEIKPKRNNNGFGKPEKNPALINELEKKLKSWRERQIEQQD